MTYGRIGLSEARNLDAVTVALVLALALLASLTFLGYAMARGGVPLAGSMRVADGYGYGGGADGQTIVSGPFLR